MGARQSAEMQVALDLVQIPVSGYFAAIASGVSKGALYRSVGYKSIKIARGGENATSDPDSFGKSWTAMQDPEVVADILEKVNSITNDGRGSSVCKSVISLLRKNDVDSARRVASHDFDKVRQYPNLAFVFERTGLLNA